VDKDAHTSLQDAATQTNGSIQQERIIINHPNSGSHRKRWIFQKNLRKKPKMVVCTNGKKRGRKPKKVVEDALSEIHDDTCESLNAKTTTGNQTEPSVVNDKENILEKARSDLNDSELDVKLKSNKCNGQVRVSRSGRVIKPKKNDDYIVYVKKEMLDELEDELKPKLEDAIEAMDDEENDPSYDKMSGSLSTRTEQNYNCVCELCGFTTKKLSEFNAHYREHLHAEKKCSICGWVCDDPDISTEEFEAHLKSHDGPQRFSCSFCSMKFSSKANLYQHLPKHSDERPFVCMECNASFKWKHALKTHLITHYPSKTYLCDTCGFSTAHKSILKDHSLIHTGETIKCTEPGCTYQALRKCNLRSHMLTHTGEKPHQCNKCGSSFGHLKNLKRHMLLHNPDKNYRCELCFFSSTRYDKLKEHYFRQHNIGTKPGKKMRITDYLNTEEAIIAQQSEENDQQTVIEEPVIHMNDMETIELQVVESTEEIDTTQIVNVTSSTGESIPIAITQQGKAITYEIPMTPSEEGKEISYAIPMIPCDMVRTEDNVKDTIVETTEGPTD